MPGHDVTERTASEAAEGQEAIHDVTQEVEVAQQLGAVGTRLSEQNAAFPVRRAQFGVAHVPDIHQEVEDVPQSASCRSEVRG